MCHFTTSDVTMAGYPSAWRQDFDQIWDLLAVVVPDSDAREVLSFAVNDIYATFEELNEKVNDLEEENKTNKAQIALLYEAFNGMDAELAKIRRNLSKKK